MPRAIVVGNSDGIGLAFTELLLREGWSVAGVSRSVPPLHEPASQLHEPASQLHEPAYQHHPLDVADPAYGSHLRELVAAFGVPDALVYCAGIGEHLEPETLALERRVFEVNLLGAVATAEVILPLFLREARGHFIGLSSQGDRFADPSAPSYGASKAALSRYLEALALAYRPHGVFVTNLRFGFVDTKMAKASVRPFMISREHAAARIHHCLRTRPIRDTYPKRMAPLLWLLGGWRELRLSFG